MPAPVKTKTITNSARRTLTVTAKWLIEQNTDKIAPMSMSLIKSTNSNWCRNGSWNGFLLNAHSAPKGFRDPSPHLVLERSKTLHMNMEVLCLLKIIDNILQKNVCKFKHITKPNLDQHELTNNTGLILGWTYRTLGGASWHPKNIFAAVAHSGISKALKGLLCYTT
jgi:hypothetical protein